MDPLSDLIINNLLRTNEQGILFQREDDQVEFKAIFNNDSKEAKAKYAKELAALYNCKGGYLVFGVDDKTNKLIGLEGFSEPDNADLSNDINTYFSPAIGFQSKSMTLNGKTVFVIYVPKRESIAAVCIKSFQQEIKESTIYWRYSGQASPIRAGDLINLLNEIRGEENKKQTEILEKEYRAKFKPRLFVANSAENEEGTMLIYLANRGKIGFIDRVFVSKVAMPQGNEMIESGCSKDTFDRDGFSVIWVRSGSRTLNDYGYTVLVEYHDQEEFKYELTIVWSQGEAIMQKPIEL